MPCKPHNYFLNAEYEEQDIDRKELDESIKKIRDSVKELKTQTAEDLAREAKNLTSSIVQAAETAHQELQNSVNEISQNIDELSEQLDTEVNAVNNRIYDTESRVNTKIDNIIAHNNDTEGNSELIDIRTGVDGTVYQSAGSAVREQISDLQTCTGRLSKITDIQWESGYIGNNGLASPDDDLSRKRTCFIPCRENIKITYKAETNHPNVSALTAYDIDKHVLAVNVNVGANNTEYEFTTPTGTRHIRLSTKISYQTSLDFSDPLVFYNIGKNFSDIKQLETQTLSNTSSINDIQRQLNNDLKTAFVSNDGSDDNIGNSLHPFATVNKALRSKAEQIIIAAGIYEQQIDLSNAAVANVNLLNGSSTERIIFRPADSLLTTEESLVQGYTRVHSANVSAEFASANKWIFQDGIADETTLIAENERLPVQRGYTYRCEDTKIQKCSSLTIEDAKNEIENSDTYKWFFDSSSNTLYFSRPQTVTSEHPLRASFGQKLFLNASKNISLNITGIETKYMMFNISDTSNSIITDCKASNVFGEGAFIYSRCIGAKFNRCEAARCFYGSNGDGFNAHSNNLGDKHSKQTTVTIFECWSHDNNDDGYSDHERSETTIIGGLYEYNGKAGITPSYGSHCNCYDVYSRHNNNGFFYIGEATEAEGGKYGQLYCNGCVAENNTAGGETQSGFIISNAGNSAVLVNCKSIGNKYGYYANLATNGMVLIDCGSKDNTFHKFGKITNKNTTIVE